MAKAQTYDVTIAGGGFVGMTLALALAQAAPKGFRVALVDAEPLDTTKVDARATALSAASRGLLAVLGIWPELAENAQAMLSIEITDSALDASRRPHLLGFDDELKPGDRALLVYPAGLEFIAAFFGCMYAGIVAVPATYPKPKRPMPRLQRIAVDCDAHVALSTAQTLTTLDPDRTSAEAMLPEWSQRTATCGSSTCDSTTTRSGRSRVNRMRAQSERRKPSSTRMARRWPERA